MYLAPALKHGLAANQIAGIAALAAAGSPPIIRPALLQRIPLIFILSPQLLFLDSRHESVIAVIIVTLPSPRRESTQPA